MRLLTLSEIEKLDSGEIIPAFTGTIKKVFAQKSGENIGENKKKYGPTWHIQNAIVTDGENEVQISWGGEDSLSDLEGKVVTFESTDTKHGKQGLKWEVRGDVNGKVYKSVKITGAAKIHSGGTDISEKGQAEKHAEEWIEKKRPTQETTVVLDESDPVKECKRHLMRILNTFWLIERGVSVEAEQSQINGFTTEPAHLQAKCSTAFINLDRAGFVAKMSVTPLWSITAQRSTVQEKAGELADKIEQEGLHGVKDKEGGFVW